MATSIDETRHTDDASRDRRTVAMPSFVLGIGLGGLFDGIVFHQILQWHHMLTSTQAYDADTVRGLEVNTLWDGLFHAVAYAAVATGLFWLWSPARRGGRAWTWRSLLGWGLVGWGAFNLAEGIVDHHVLAIHHVRAGPNELTYDLAFLASGVALAVAGWLIARTDRPRAAPSGGLRRGGETRPR